jgi:hypothetical protein
VCRSSGVRPSGSRIRRSSAGAAWRSTIEKNGLHSQVRTAICPLRVEVLLEARGVGSGPMRLTCRGVELEEPSLPCRGSREAARTNAGTKWCLRALVGGNGRFPCAMSASSRARGPSIGCGTYQRLRTRQALPAVRGRTSLAPNAAIRTHWPITVLMESTALTWEQTLAASCPSSAGGSGPPS